jgi:hypothetical protein
MANFSTNVKNCELPLWFVVYDESSLRSYAFADFESVLLSIEGSVKTYHGDDDTSIEIAVELMLAELRRMSHLPCIPVKYDNLQITIYRFVLDSMHPLVKLLEKCHRQIGDHLLKSEIESFFCLRD